MGIQAMASQRGSRQQSSIQSLAKQGSIYSLTLSEVENHLGEPLHSMNLDDLVRSVLPADGDRALSMNYSGATAHHGQGLSTQHQGSDTMQCGLSKKTVDEVWRDIQQKKSSEEQSSGGHEGQPTFGKMTLEDFLTKAGLVTEGTEKRLNSHVGNLGPAERGQPMAGAGFTQGMHWLQQYHQMHQQQAQQSVAGGYAYPEGQLSISPRLVETTSDPQTPGRRRRQPEEVVEKNVERRQKRMIKNRESAARSRARKQAYTNELENKVSRLEEENERLKKQRELDTLLCYPPPPEPKYQLRRTSSSTL